MAIGLIKDCIKEKVEILTSQGTINHALDFIAINHALDFVDKTNNQIKEEFNEDMQQVVEQDKVESGAINDAIEKNPEIIQSHSSATPKDESSLSTTVTAPEKSEEDRLEDADTQQKDEE
jgi:hypothetical protein